MDRVLLLLILHIMTPMSVQQPIVPDPGSVQEGYIPGISECLAAPLASGQAEWNNDVSGSHVSVEWTYGTNTCNSINTCFGVSQPKDISLEPQIRPIQAQTGQAIRFYASSNMDVVFGIQPYAVDEIGFRSCDFTRGRPVIRQPSSAEFFVAAKFLLVGANYFIAKTNDPLYDCRFGLRLNVSIKPEACSGVGETVYCWGRGRCATDFLNARFACRCCQGYAGAYCKDRDACLDAPCINGGQCTHRSDDITGAKFVCSCPIGYYGNQCESRVSNLCETNPCENSATCEGNQTSYTCHCRHGYSGHHCEIDNNNCALRPCVNGICVDKVGGHQCYCTPGYGGSDCDQELDECLSNSCGNDGFCVNGPDGSRCQCSQGYTGDTCHVKVDLCDPSPCTNATECIDFGHTYQCTCNPGFKGFHCEININECQSNPCMNGGKCRDVISGYLCVCPEDVSGIHCEYKRMDLPRHTQDKSYQSMLSGSVGVSHLYIAAGTLAGALLIALAVLAGCYCRVHETYRVFCHQRDGYTRQHSETLLEKKDACGRQMARQVLDPGPSMEAILEVSELNQSSAHNTRLVNSLKPRRV